MADTDSPSDLLATVSAAFDEAEKADTPAPVVEAAPEAAPEAEVDTRTAEDRARDDKGRFAPKPLEAKGGKATVTQKTEPEAKLPPGAASVSATPPPLDKAPPIRAPQSWTPAEREEFGKLPKVAQEAVLRRETEHAKLLEESAQHRNGFQSFQRMVQPYEGLIRSRGGEPAQVMETALRAYVGLHTSPPHVQAQMVANMVRSLRIPIEALDSALVNEGQQAPQGQGQPTQPQFDEAAIERRLIDRIERQRASQEVSSWSNGKEFFADVQGTMRAILMDASERGQEMTLDQAYERACRADPSVSTVLEGRKAEEAKRTREADLAQKRVAATSVRSSPAGRMNGAAPGKSVVDFVERAWNAQEGV